MGNSNSNSSSTIETVDSAISYESPDVEWCRLRPMWRTKGKDESSPNNNNDTVRNKCAKVLGYDPDVPNLVKTRDLRELFPEFLSSTYDVARRETKEKEPDHQLPVLERPLFQTLATCMDQALAEQQQQQDHAATSLGAMKRARVTKIFRNQTGHPVMALVEDVLVEDEVRAVLALSNCEKQHVPEVFEWRPFDEGNVDGGEDDADGGGNDCTYLSGFLQLLVPGVASRIHHVAHLTWITAGWDQREDVFEDQTRLEEQLERLRKQQPPHSHRDVDVDAPITLEDFAYSTRKYPNPLTETGIRTSEHLEYKSFKKLSYHEDADSDYTVVTALSHPEDYVDGDFQLCPNDDASLPHNTKDSVEKALGQSTCPGKISIKPPRRSALVFLSTLHHGIEKIGSSGRVTFVNELWRYEDAPATSMRPELMEFFFNDKTLDDDLDDEEDAEKDLYHTEAPQLDDDEYEYVQVEDYDDDEEYYVYDDDDEEIIVFG